MRAHHVDDIQRGEAARQVVERHVEVELQLLLLRRIQHDARLLLDAEVRLRRKQAGSGSGQLLLRRLLSTPGHVSGYPELRPASANPSMPCSGKPCSGRAGRPCRPCFRQDGRREVRDEEVGHDDRAEERDRAAGQRRLGQVARHFSVEVHALKPLHGGAKRRCYERRAPTQTHAAAQGNTRRPEMCVGEVRKRRTHRVALRPLVSAVGSRSGASRFFALCSPLASKSPCFALPTSSRQDLRQQEDR